MESPRQTLKEREQRSDGWVVWSMGRRRVLLRGISPEAQGRTWESSSLLRLGRLESLEVVLTDASVSRRHAEVEYLNGVWVVRDLGSTNGTFLNQVRVGRVDQRLKAGDVLQCGNVALRVEVAEAESGTEPGLSDSTMRIELSTRHSWEMALELWACEGVRDDLSRDRMLRLLRIGRDFGQIASLDALLESILREAVAALKAQGGAILLLDEHSSRLEQRAVVPASRLNQAPTLMFDLAERALRQGESLISHDTRADLDSVLRRLLADSTPAYVICALLRTPSRRLGILQVDRGPKQMPFTEADLRLADALAASVSSVIASVAALLDRERDLLVQTLTALAQAVELRDDYTGSHTQRVTDYAMLLAERLQLGAQDRYHLQIGTPLHDIGKIGISDAILRKPAGLTPDEIEYMKTHTVKGAAMIEMIPHLAPIIPIVRNHHERWDGLGYPDGLRGVGIPHLARIVAVADAFDAMTTDRPYRPSLAVDQALNVIEQEAGRQFDPDFALAFVAMRDTLEDIVRQNRQMHETWSRNELLRMLEGNEGAPSSRRRTTAIPRASLAAIKDKLSQAS